MRFVTLCLALAAASASASAEPSADASPEVGTANPNAPRDGSAGQPPRLPMRDIASNVMRDVTGHVKSFAASGSGARDATGRCPAGQKAVSNGKPAIANGCGPAKFEGLVPELWFNACCVKHDLCYGDCGASKGACDSAFGACTKAACVAEFDGWNPRRWVCRAKAGLYTAAVKIGGQSSFESNTAKHCLCVEASAKVRRAGRHGEL
ncbi:hypothetical protein CspeluHIS016_0505750 [Cutaneotrichosporon spelunceum]|uniref:Phospholipase A2 n=1 Tax=Cutaneotrichosporon spelunceum TaxID=1672016 RepID=A0AAD3TX74_9TREE|nr:hypothetical protein CspeluHIS016_0505750 [Cutaneotrichosporon spelunceum]